MPQLQLGVLEVDGSLFNPDGLHLELGALDEVAASQGNAHRRVGVKRPKDGGDVGDRGTREQLQGEEHRRHRHRHRHCFCSLTKLAS